MHALLIEERKSINYKNVKTIANCEDNICLQRQKIDV